MMNSRAAPFFAIPCIVVFALLVMSCPNTEEDQTESLPDLVLSADSLAFSAVAGGANPGSQSVTVTSSGNETVGGLGFVVQYSKGSGWLFASWHRTGYAAMVARDISTPATLVVEPNVGTLEAGVYSAVISISSDEAGNGPQAVAVTLNVGESAVPRIGLSTTGLSFAATEGGGDPPSRTVTVSNAGSGTLGALAASVSYASGSGWLAAALDRTTAPATLTVSPKTSVVMPGTYGATISVSSSSAINSPQTISVAFTVGEEPLITLSASSLSFSSTGDNTPAGKTVSISNGGGGSLGGLGAAVAYGAGMPVGWLTASLDTSSAPATLAATIATAGFSPGTYQATIFVASESAGNSPQSVSVTWTKASIAGPVLSSPVVSGNTVALSWTFAWPALGSTSDRYMLEESTTSSGSGFTQIGSYSTRASPYSVSLSRSNGTYWYRVRARTASGNTDYSAVRTAQVSAVTATRFQNDAVWSIIYLTIDGVQQFPDYPQGIAPGSFAQGQFSVGTHSYEARTGFWESDDSRFELYIINGDFTQASGQIGTVTIDDPTIGQLLARFGSDGIGNWSGYFFDSGVYHYYTLRFRSNGSFTVILDGMDTVASGAYRLGTYNPGLVQFFMDYAGGASYEGLLNEIYGTVNVRNGPASWPLIEYTFDN